MGFEGLQRAEVPEPLKEYETLWNELYGKDLSTYLTQLEAIAARLAADDQEFAALLSQTEKRDANDERENARAWTLINALSTYGLKFGLKVD